LARARDKAILVTLVILVIGRPVVGRLLPFSRHRDSLYSVRDDLRPLKISEPQWRAEVNFEILPGDASSPYVVHVPHSSTRIPDDVRAHLLLDEDSLAEELRRMTDARTDELAILAASQVAPRPWLFVNRLSRLVVDPERLPDEHEVMFGVGMGAVYTRTSGGLVLREDDERVRGSLLSRFFTPYAEAMADLVDERISATGRAVVLDLHSYPVKALPYERFQDARRPPVCLGVDFDHTPAVLVERASRACSALGDVVVNEPFVGSYIPLRHFGRDIYVTSVMVELRRDVYLRGDGSLDQKGADKVVEALVAILKG
jgi:N-formylglutamate amidohydrolase